MQTAHRWRLVALTLILGIVPLLILFGRPLLGQAAPVLQESTIALTKTASVTEATWGEEITYTLAFTFPTGTNITDTLLVDCIPNHNPRSEPYFDFLTASVVGPAPASAGTPPLAASGPTHLGDYCWGWTLGEGGHVVNTSGSDNAYTLTYSVRVRADGSSLRGELGINESTLSWGAEGQHVSDSATVTVVLPNIANSLQIEGPGGQIAQRPGSGHITDLRAGDFVTLTLAFENVADLYVSPAYSVVLYSMVPNWITDIQPLEGTQTPGTFFWERSTNERYTMVNWYAPHTGTGAGEVAALDRLDPGDAHTYTFRGRVVDDVSPNLRHYLRGFGMLNWSSKFKTLPGLPGDSGFYNEFAYHSAYLYSKTSAIQISAEDPAPVDHVATGEVITYTVTYTIPAGTTLNTPASVDVDIPSGLIFGGVLEQPAGFTGPTVTVGSSTELLWTLDNPVTAAADTAHTFVYTVTTDANSNLGRRATLRTRVDLRHPNDPYPQWLSQLWESFAVGDVWYARPTFYSLQKCLWRDGRCETRNLNVEGDEQLVFHIRYTRNGGNSYTDLNEIATLDAYDVTAWDLLPPGFTLVDAWPTTYTTATIGSRTAITWTPWISVPKGTYIPGVEPPTPSITDSIFVITATVPITMAGPQTFVNEARILYSDAAGTPFVDQSNLTMLARVTTIKEAVGPRDDLDIRIGELITYTITDQIPKGVVLYWPLHQDILPVGVHPLLDTFDLTDATLISMADLDTSGNRVSMGWSMETLQGPRTVVNTWQTRLTGVDSDGNLVADTFNHFRGAPSIRNDEWLRWNTEDVQGDPVDSLSANRNVRIIQPLLADPNDQSAFVKTLAGTPTGTPYVVPGDIVTYELTLRNTGYAPAFDVILSDTLPAAMSFVTYTAELVTESGAPAEPIVVEAPVPGDTTLRWQLAEIPSRPSGRLTLRYAVQIVPEAGPGAVLTNTVRLLDYSSMPGEDAYERHYASWHPDTVRSSEPITVTPPVVTAALTKSGPTAVLPGETFTYTLTYTKTGRGAQTGILTDTLPADLAYGGYTADPPVTLLTGAPAPSWQLGPLADGATGRVVITVTAPLTLPIGTILTNNADLTVDYADPATAAAETLVSGPILAVSKTAPAWVVPGGTLVYTVQVSNTGNLSATGTLITETYAAGTTFVSADPAPTTGSDVWQIGDLAPGQSRTLVITTTVDPLATDGTTLVNRVAADAANHGVVTGTTTVEVVTNRIALTKTAPTVVNAGDLLTYTLTYTATGLDGALGAVLTEAYPEHTTYESASPPPDADTDTWHLGDVVAGTTGSVQVVLRVSSPLTNGVVLTNTAIITSQNDVTDTAAVSTTVRSGPALEISKTSEPAHARPGEPLVYTLRYRNSGTEAATGVVITETYDADTAFVKASPAPTGGDSVWHLGTLGIGSGEIVITTTVSLSVEDNSALINRVALDSVETEVVETSLTTWVRSGRVYLPLVLRDFRRAPDLVIVDLTVAPPSPTLSETVCISITVENRGNAPAAGFWVDLYIDPTQAPAPGDVWHAISPVGKAWLIRDPLLPGEQIVIDTTQPDDPLNPDDRYSNWPGAFTTAGTRTLYAQVDSYPGTSGAVIESDETNNLFGPLHLSVAPATLNGVRIMEVPLPSDESLSTRP